MFGGVFAQVVRASAVTAVVATATIPALSPAPGGAAVPPASSGPSVSDGLDDGFSVNERVARIDPSRPAAVDADVVGHDHEGADADDEHGTSEATGSVELVHRDEPELLIISDVEPGTTLAVRSRNDGEWSDWISVTADPGEAPDGRPGEEGAAGVQGVGPIWIGDDAERTEIALLEGGDTRITVEELTAEDDVVTAPSTAAPAPGSSIRAGAVSAAATTSPRPTIRPRSDWATSSMGYRCSGGPEYSDNIRAAVVHHTASTTSYSSADVPSIIRAFWRHHTQTNGWCDIAYNFLVDRFGTIWEGRVGGVDRPVIGGHAKGFNTWTTGVAAIGEFGSAPAYSSMMGATERLLSWKLSLHGVDPAGWTELVNRATSGPMKHRAGAVLHVPTVLGHRDLGLTSCPGSNVYAVLGSLRRSLAATARRNDAAPYLFPRWQPSATGVAVATVDSAGGIRVAGAAAPTSVVVPGTPIAVDGGDGKGYVLTSDGGLTPFSGAPEQPAVSVADAADLVVRRDGRSGWVLGRDGHLTGFGGASPIPPGTTTSQAVAAEIEDSGRGYVLLRSGWMLPVGGAPQRSVDTGGSPALDLAVRSDGTSGWVLSADGGVHGFGGAPWLAWPKGASAARSLLLAGDESGVAVLDADGRMWPLGGAPAVMPMASHVGSSNAVAAARLGRPGLATSDLAQVVTAQHELFLRSTPDADAVERWYHRAERVGRVVAALDMTRSDAYAGLVIDDLYRRVLDREADPGGRAGWLSAIRGGMRIETIASAFYGSKEYVQEAGSYERFVELLYENLLFRASDPGGKSYWTRNLYERRMTPTQVAAGFYGSLESRRDRVTRLYRQILDRAPDPGGLEHWAEQLITKDDLVLAADLAGSKEFYVRVLEGSL